MPEESIAALEQRRAHLCQQLASIGEMRSGSLMGALPAQRQDRLRPL